MDLLQKFWRLTTETPRHGDFGRGTESVHVILPKRHRFGTV
jgi:hypothetical protein